MITKSTVQPKILSANEIQQVSGGNAVINTYHQEELFGINNKLTEVSFQTPPRKKPIKPS